MNKLFYIFRWGQFSAESVGCPNHSNENITAQVECLQNVPLYKLVYSPVQVGFNGPMPVIDGSFSKKPFLPDYPRNLMSGGEYNPHVNILLGSNR